ncbi:MAG: potassium transporter TrkG [Blautia sp.]|nr:potassium transporter KtrB [Blautia sp.]MDY3998149.1 potassium transporter TrkG [Blautia sp.]
MTTAQVIACGFAALILTGGLILWMPFCTAPGQSTSFTDAVFTATTCVCVTGLVTVTTATHWTLAGKIVMLILIQIGGIGFIALASIIFISLRKKISMRSRKMIQESYNLDQMSGLVRMVKRVVACVFGAEAVGAVCYAFCFIPEFGVVKGIWQSVFTSVSAFCNAGVDILGENSLMSYVDDPAVNFITIALIITAGLGFIVWWDVADKIRKVFRRELSVHRIFRSLRLHSKLVLTTTAVLVLGGTVLIFIFEYNNPRTMADMPLWQKMMASLFQSVTTRTAGFLTIDQAAFSGASVLLCLFLMFIGGSPMGTAGGMKTTTVAVMVLSVVSNLRGKEDVEFRHRRIRNHYIRSAVVIVGMGFGVLLTMSMLLSAVMPETSLVDIVYEITSAIATVGLSRGLTSQLTAAGKWIVILTMYLGRIGPMTLGMAVVVRAQKRSENTRLAAEDIMIG